MKFCVCHYKAKRRDIQYLVRISPGPAKNCRLPVCFPCIFAKLFYFHVNDTEEKQMDKLDAGRLKAAVFDWDGTLAETRTPRLWAVNRIMAKYGLPDWESTREKQNKQLSFMDDFPLVFGSRAEEAYREYAELYKANVARMIKTFPGVRETLAFLRQKGVKIAIMTNKDRRLLEFELPLLYDVSLFDRIVCGHEAAHDKPCGDHARFALKGLVAESDIAPQSVWIVGDSVLDNMCAEAVGALPVRIVGGCPEVDRTGSPDVIYFNDFEQFYRSLAG